MHRPLSTASRPWTADKIAGCHAVLLVSPHYDDAALSAGAIADLGRPIDIATVFTRASSRGVLSAWDRRCGFASEEAALAARDLEDRRAFAAEDHRLLRLGLVENAYAGNAPRPTAETGQLQAWFDHWHAASGDPAPLVLLPVGAGRAVATGMCRRAAALAHRGALRFARRLGLPGEPPGAAQHPDHLWVRDALAGHVVGRGAKLGFYEEQPYHRGRRGDAAAAELGRRLKLTLTQRELSVDVVAKSRRIAAYASQIDELLRSDPHATRPEGVERYWFVA